MGGHTSDVGRWEDGQDVGWGNPRLGDVGSEKYAITKWRVSMNIKIFVAIGMGSSCCGNRVRTTLNNSVARSLFTLYDHHLALDNSDRKSSVFHHV